jgi:uncharacterized membrane protein SpoIIM required for sporulation
LREALFIKKNKKRWDEIKYLPSTEPDEMANEFKQLVEDVSYSKTFYPHSHITQFLNEEAGKRYLSIYENQKSSKQALKFFFTHQLPWTIAKHHMVLLCSGILFVTFVAIGAFSAHNDQTFVRQILGDDYVNMTEQNIAAGTPFKVYSMGNEFLSFLGIFINNILVSLKEFAGGMLLGIPTLQGLMYNSIMVGAFEYMFFKNNVGIDSLLTVMIHGTLELFTFVVAAASGFVLAKSWLFPGTYTRLYALQKGAKEGLMIALSNFPMLLVAGFFEGFVTRHTNMPLLLSLLIIGGSLAFIIFYFIVYPIKIKKQFPNLYSY